MSTKQKGTEQLDPSGGNVEQIREILFGGHIRAFDERFEIVESRLAKESESLRKAIEKRVLELERLLAEYRDEAEERLGGETSNRDLALNKVELALAQARMDAENRMAALEERFAGELKQIGTDIRAMHRELTQALDRVEKAQEKRSAKLAEDKVARRELAGMFEKLAKGLQPGKASRSR
jgi:hypothetical protein